MGYQVYSCKMHFMTEIVVTSTNSLTPSGDKMCFCNFTANKAQNSPKQSSASSVSLFMRCSLNDLIVAHWENSLFTTLNYAIWFTPAHGNIHTLMSFCSVNVCHLASRSAIRHFSGGTGREKCDPHVNNRVPVTLRIQFTPSDGLLWNSITLTLQQQIRNHIADNWLCLFSIASEFHLPCLNDAPSPQVVQEPTPFVWALPFFMCTGGFAVFVFFFFCHILSNLFAESHKSHSQFNEHPQNGSARKKKCAPSSTTLMSMQCSDIFPSCFACQGKTHIVYSPITNSKWQRIFRHSGQICKISGNEFQSALCQSDLQV